MSVDILMLVKRARSGDEGAFEDIVSLYTPMMQAAAVKYSLDFDEVFSEACMSLFRAVSSYDIEQTEVTFGLYAQVCVRHALSDVASRRFSGSYVECDIDDIDVADDGDDVGDELVSREESERFRSDARELLSRYEYDVLLRWLGGDKTADIAAALSVSAKSVDNAKARILKKLRDGLRPS